MSAPEDDNAAEESLQSADTLETVEQALAESDLLAESDGLAESGESALGAITSPPPAGAYRDLVSGRVHTRQTPAFGIHTASLGDQRWVVVSQSAELIDHVSAAVAPDTDLIIVSALSELKLGLAPCGLAVRIIVDAECSPLPMDDVIKSLTAAFPAPQVFLWRMAPEALLALRDNHKTTRRWLSFAGEVKAEEIVQLLTLGST